MNLDHLDFSPPHDVMRPLRMLAGLGGLTLLIGLVLAPQRFWPNLLLVSYYLLGLGLAGIFFVALQYVTGAGWSVALRRVPEAMSATVPVAALGLGIVFLAKPSLYPWFGALLGSADAPSGFKQVWLNRPFFLARSAIYLLIWITLTLAIVRTSRRQDKDGDFSHTRRNIRLSAAFLVLFAFTFWQSSYDWIMSLEPQWSSTIFGVYSFAGMFLSGLAALIILVVALDRLGPLHNVLSEEHLHDLGKLLFAFSTFWMYIWFSQYMLIWYANIPEETAYFVRRLQGSWKSLFLLNMFLNWAIPFAVLLHRGTKRNPRVLVKVAIVILLGRWLDLYLMVVPPVIEGQPVFGPWELGSILGAVGLFSLVFFHAFRQAPVIPVKDPYLVESLQSHS